MKFLKNIVEILLEEFLYGFSLFDLGLWVIFESNILGIEVI